jgi:archaellin
VKNEDNSCSATTPVINKSDSVLIAVNTTVSFYETAQNTNIKGTIIPSDGAWGIINFGTPSAFVKPIMIL